ncbi:hypothetical protein SADUNF_Sadunf16G0271600 [Salix dunnii]|uniref:ubiquitinyl hydrolase 1 n=1 Tax=Salix dunnii TaxID=1413687 RepID=A0A835JGN5_9ROSI|nr:hypothetical protein SADUNF_Sadunf16G0271600 [Salix dunnii]
MEVSKCSHKSDSVTSPSLGDTTVLSSPSPLPLQVRINFTLKKRFRDDKPDGPAPIESLSGSDTRTNSSQIQPRVLRLFRNSVELPEKVRLAVDAIIMAEGAERKEQLAAWIADKKQVSAYAMSLPQIDNGVFIPPSRWKCAKCDQKYNMWLNLADGIILCGRKNWDETGDNNHAIEHYKETSYPPTVKLGTITADLEAAGRVPSLALKETHKTPKNLRTNHGYTLWQLRCSLIQSLPTVIGTEFKKVDSTGKPFWTRLYRSCEQLLHGNNASCVFNSVLQFTTFTSSSDILLVCSYIWCNCVFRCYINHSLKMAFEMAPADPTVDTKLAHGMLSGKYLIPALENDDKANAITSTSNKQEGAPPRMFKAVIAASHPEFSSMRQQCRSIPLILNAAIDISCGRELQENFGN